MEGEHAPPRSLHDGHDGHDGHQVPQTPARLQGRGYTPHRLIARQVDRQVDILIARHAQRPAAMQTQSEQSMDADEVGDSRYKDNDSNSGRDRHQVAQLPEDVPFDSDGGVDFWAKREVELKRSIRRRNREQQRRNFISFYCFTIYEFT